MDGKVAMQVIPARGLKLALGGSARQASRGSPCGQNRVAMQVIPARGLKLFTLLVNGVFSLQELQCR
jgi:hypothetical protein